DVPADLYVLGLDDKRLTERLGVPARPGDRADETEQQHRDHRHRDPPRPHRDRLVAAHHSPGVPRTPGAPHSPRPRPSSFPSFFAEVAPTVTWERVETPRSDRMSYLETGRESVGSRATPATG